MLVCESISSRAGRHLSGEKDTWREAEAPSGGRRRGGPVADLERGADLIWPSTSAASSSSASRASSLICPEVADQDEDAVTTAGLGRDSISRPVGETAQAGSGASRRDRASVDRGRCRPSP